MFLLTSCRRVWLVYWPINCATLYAIYTSNIYVDGFNVKIKVNCKEKIPALKRLISINNNELYKLELAHYFLIILTYAKGKVTVFILPFLISHILYQESMLIKLGFLIKEVI